jgi:hypothetical protein
MRDFDGLSPLSAAVELGGRLAEAAGLGEIVLTLTGPAEHLALARDFA